VGITVNKETVLLAPDLVIALTQLNLKSGVTIGGFAVMAWSDRLQEWRPNGDSGKHWLSPSLHHYFAQRLAGFLPEDDFSIADLIEQAREACPRR
jgi:hypothetical protein